jgi:hypothetical protein
LVHTGPIEKFSPRRVEGSTYNSFHPREHGASEGAHERPKPGVATNGSVGAKPLHGRPQVRPTGA